MYYIYIEIIFIVFCFQYKFADKLDILLMILGTIAGIFQNIYSAVLRHVPRPSLSSFRFAFYEHFSTHLTEKVHFHS
jgi:disulfide bond formation protein DsbB